MFCNKYLAVVLHVQKSFQKQTCEPMVIYEFVKLPKKFLLSVTSTFVRNHQKLLFFENIYSFFGKQL